MLRSLPLRLGSRRRLLLGEHALNLFGSQELEVSWLPCEVRLPSRHRDSGLDIDPVLGRGANLDRLQRPRLSIDDKRCRTERLRLDPRRKQMRVRFDVALPERP